MAVSSTKAGEAVGGSCAHPDHQHGFPDVPDAVVHQPGGVDELVLIHGLGRVGAQRFHCSFHLLRETWHD